MPRSPKGFQSSLAQAMHWVSQVTTIAFEMVLPALGGYWLDRRWGTTPGLTITGAVLGFVVSMYHLLQLVRRLNEKSRRSQRKDAGPKP